MNDQKGELVAAKPMATGRKLVVAPADDRLRLAIESKTGDLQLIDGRYLHNNGWFVVRSLVATGAVKNAVEWVITPNVITGWIGDPVIHVSQVGYHPVQPKFAFIELDKNDPKRENIELVKISADGSRQPVFSEKPGEAIKFLRYNYLKLDFSGVKDSGLFMIKYGNQYSQVFRIANNVFERNVWQPHSSIFFRFRCVICV